MKKDIPFNPELDLILERVVDIPKHLIFQAWTQPELMKQWFCPKPWQTIEAEVELFPGGRMYTVMQSPEGVKYPNEGSVLEVIPNERLVWTSALGKGFRPLESDMPFTGMILLEDHPEGTKYTARCLHKTAAHRQQHADMGFEQGWGICLDQLVALMKTKR